MKHIAILMAAGRGTRVGGKCPKQFVRVRDKMLMEYALQTFQEHNSINEIVVVLPADCPDEVKCRLRESYPKITAFVPGGAERFLSSWNAVQCFAARREDCLLLHDAARPGVTARILDDVVNALQTEQAVVTAMPATDTVLRVDAQHTLLGTLPRPEIYYAQTPQAFRAGLLYDCFMEFFEKQDFMPTDESGIVARYRPDVTVRVVLGDSRNAKITYSEELQSLIDVGLNG